MLGELLALSLKISETILALHKTGRWVHKNVSAHNVMFFLDIAEKKKVLLKSFLSIPKHQHPPLPIDVPQPVDKETKQMKEPQKSWRPKFLKKSKSQLYTSQASSRAASTTHLARDIPEQPVSKGPEESFSSSMATLHSPPPTHRPTVDVSLPAKSLQEFYVVGFNYSREDSNTVFTSGASKDIGQRFYHHPEYLNESTHQRFQMHYEYYSLGIVMLEIGFWRRLEEMCDSEGKIAAESNPEKRRQRMIKELVPQLGVTMGSRYRDAVSICLEGKVPTKDETRGDGSSDQSLLKWMDFEEHVVRPLRGCCV